MRKIAALLLALLFSIPAQAQPGPPPFNGGTIYNPLITAVPTVSASGLNLPPGVGPTIPNNGDLWTTNLGIYVQINGATIGPLGTGGGGGGSPGGSSGQIQYNAAGTFGGFTLGGDCSFSVPNVTCTKTNGTSFGTFATQNSATPPAIGGTTPAAGSFSSLTDTGILGLTQCLQINSIGLISGTGSACGSGSGSVSSVFSRTGIVIAQSGDYNFGLISGSASLSQLQTISANTIVGNGTAGSASPTGLSVPSCSSANQALNWTSASGFGCVTIFSSVTSVFGRTGAVTAQSGDYTFAQIGSTPTTLSGYGITSPLPVAQGGTAATTAGATAANNIGALAIASNLSDLASAGTARTNLGLGTFATQNFATPPAIGGTTPAAGSFTTLIVTGITTLAVTGGGTQCLQANNTGVVSGTGGACPGSTASVTAETFCATAGTGCAATTFTPGTTTSFSLSALPVNAAATTVMFDGIVQAHNTWSLSSSTLTLSAAVPAATQVVEISWLAVAVGGSVTSVTAADSTLTITPTTGVVTAKINLGTTNTWTGAQTFPNNSLTLAEFPTIGANTVIGSIAGGTPAALTTTQLTTLCNAATSSLSGCVNLGSAITWTGIQTFPNNSLTLAEFPTIAANTAIGSIAGGTPAALTATQLTTLCNSFTSSLSGCAPSSGGGTTNFLRADGSWAVPGGSSGLTVGTSTIASGTTLRVLYDNGGVLGEYTNVQLTALCQAFTSTLSGCVPAGGSTTNTFLRFDGTFAVPASILTVGTSTVISGVSTRVLYDNAGVLGEYTNVQLTALCQAFTSTLSGCAPLSGGGTTNFLRADGTWAAPSGSVSLTVGTTTVISGTTLRVLYDNAGVLGEYTNIQLTALCQAFTSTLSGCAPLSGGGTTNFLRADGTWAAPAAGGLTVGTSTITSGTTLRVLYDNAGVLGEYTNIQLTALCQSFSATLSGCVPLSGGGTSTFLRADGTWAFPTVSLTVGTSTISSGTSLRVLYDNAGVLGEYTNTQLTALCQTVTSTLSGCAPASGGGTTNFLRADGTWAVPGGSGGVNVATRIVIAAGAITITSTDQVVIVNKTTPAATTVNLEVSPATGHLIYIKDGGCNSASFPIMITTGSAIDNNASVVLNQNCASITLVFNSIQWQIL